MVRFGISKKKTPREKCFLLSVRVGVIETPSSAWKADILPLNYTRIWKTVLRILTNKEA